MSIVLFISGEAENCGGGLRCCCAVAPVAAAWSPVNAHLLFFLLCQNKGQPFSTTVCSAWLMVSTSLTSSVSRLSVIPM